MRREKEGYGHKWCGVEEEKPGRKCYSEGEPRKERAGTGIVKARGGQMGAG